MVATVCHQSVVPCLGSAWQCQRAVYGDTLDYRAAFHGEPKELSLVWAPPSIHAFLFIRGKFEKMFPVYSSLSKGFYL